MLVMKFGGTSVGGSEQIRSAAQIVAGHRDRGPVVVVSAITKVTDLLLDTARAAGNGQRDLVRVNMARLTEIHRQAITGAIHDPAIRSEISHKVSHLLTQLRRAYTGIVLLGELSPRSLDTVASYGERCSSLVVAGTLRDLGVPSQAVSATDLIVTDDLYGSATPLMEETRQRTEAIIAPLVAQGIVPVVTGFIGATRDGVITTLGRGGSDYSASILAACLGSEQLWIWTDVTGVKSADPRIVAEARTLPRLSYAEAVELSYYGAKVIHPRTMIPAVESGIPIWIKNTFAPEQVGTLIHSSDASPQVVKAVTSIRRTGMITVAGAGLIGGPGIVARVFAIVARRNTNLLMISQSSSAHNVCFVVNDDVADQLVADLEREFAPELARQQLEGIALRRDVSIVAVVGAGMQGTPGVAGRVFNALGRYGINVIAIAQGGSELNISFLVNSQDEQQAIQVLHDDLIVPETALVGASVYGG